MKTDYLTTRRLQALMGETLRDLPLHHIRKLEQLLDDRQSACIGSCPQCDSYSSNALSELESCGTHTRVNLVGARTSLQGAVAVLEMLHAEHHLRTGATKDELLGDRLAEGMFQAGRALVESALHSLGDTPSVGERS